MMWVWHWLKNVMDYRCWSDMEHPGFLVGVCTINEFHKKILKKEPEELSVACPMFNEAKTILKNVL